MEKSLFVYFDGEPDVHEYQTSLVRKGGLEILSYPPIPESEKTGPFPQQAFAQRLSHTHAHFRKALVSFHRRSDRFHDTSFPIREQLTFELRWLKTGNSTLRLFILVSVSEPSEKENEGRTVGLEREVGCALDMIKSALPAGVRTKRLGDGELMSVLEVGSRFTEFVDLRRRGVIYPEVTGHTLELMSGSLDSKELTHFEVPLPYDSYPSALSYLASVFSSSEGDSVIAVRFRPTSLCRLEEEALGGLKSALTEGGVLKQRLTDLLKAGGLFQCSVQVASSNKLSARNIAFAFNSDRCAGFEASEVEQRPRFLRMKALDEIEACVPRWNLSHMEYHPWGGICEKAANLMVIKNQPTEFVLGYIPVKALSIEPRIFRTRIANTHPGLRRIHQLYTFAEASHLWALPVANHETTALEGPLFGTTAVT